MLRIKNAFKKVALMAGLLSAATLAAYATSVAYTGVFQGTEGPAQATGTTAKHTYTRDMNTTGSRVSVQIVSSSYTAAGSLKFTDGSQSTGSFTVGTPAAGGIGSNPFVKVNGITVFFTYNTSYASMTATNICSSMTVVSSIINCNAAGSVVYTTSTYDGSLTNYALASSSTNIVASGAVMTGGTNSAYVVATPTITIASNNFVTGQQVVYSTGSGTAISGLTWGTTYYVSVINPNQTTGVSSTFKLSSSLANAQAGTGITLASSTTATTANSFTLAPLAFTNTSGGGIQMQWSDDNVTYFNWTTSNYGVSITSVSFATAGATTLYDMGATQHRYLRFNETPPTTGAVNYTITDNERNANGQ